MPQAASHSPHRAAIINDHLVWIPRDRKRVWVGPVEAGLKERLAEIATQSGFEILTVEVMPEPVHLLVNAPPKSAPAEMVRWFKGMTARRLKKEFESLRRQYWGEQAPLWAEGYSAGTAGQVSPETFQRSMEESRKKQFQALRL